MPGNLVHVEMPAKDGDRARKFYGELLGWKFGAPAMAEMDYCMTENSQPVVAVYTRGPEQQSGVIVYFEVEDIDKAIATAKRSGGKADDKQPIPGQGWFSSCVDTEGNSFSLFQADHSVKMPEQQAPAAASSR